MTYLVSLTTRAELDLTQLYQEIDAEHSGTAQRWYRRLKQQILTLEKYPNRHPVVRAKGKIRQLLYGRKPSVYRMIYRVLEKQKQVEVLHVRHGARQRPTASDLG